MEDGLVVQHILSGAASGLASALLTCPLDIIKVRAQLPQGRRVPLFELVQTLKQIYQKEGGVRGLYKGLPPTLIGLLPSNAIYFGIYAYLKSEVSKLRHKDVHRDSLSHLIAATCAAASTNVLTNPLWLVRTRLMAQSAQFNKFSTNNSQSTHFRQYRYTGTLGAFRSIWREEGVRAFYRGSAASILGLFHVGVYFPLYERLKLVLHSSSDNRDFSVFLASGISKLIATTLTYPHEVIRTRLQAYQPQSQSILITASSIWREEGIFGFYRGLSINILRAVPAATVTFVFYEKVLSLLR